MVLGFMGLDCVLDWALILGGPILVPSETLVIIYGLLEKLKLLLNVPKPALGNPMKI